MLISLKSKQNQDPTQPRQAISPSSLKAKSKKPKEILLKPVKSPREHALPLKRKHHLPSKSTIEMLNKYYNSPNEQPIPIKKTNKCSFTHLLQHSANPLPSNHHLTDLSHSCNSNIKDTNTRKTPLTNLSFTPCSGSILQEMRETQFSEVLRQKLELIHSQSSQSIQKSVNKSTTKSPLRISNTNRLNNTPKVKDSKIHSHKGPQFEVKTFAAVLNSSENKISQINLQCSQKFKKCVKQPQENLKLSKQELSPKSKSNLLSTGVINLSQPFQGSSSSNSYTLWQLSKEPQHSKIQVQRIINEEDNIKEFSSNSPASSQNQHSHTSIKIKQLKSKMQELNQQLISHLKQYNEHSFAQQIRAHFNPELINNCDFSKTIEELMDIGKAFQRQLKGIIAKLERISKMAFDQMTEHINALHASKQSLIDWLSIQNHLAEKECLQAQICKNEMLADRLEYLEESMKCIERKDQSFTLVEKENRYQLKELSLIECDLKKQTDEIPFWNKKQKNQTWHVQKVVLGHWRKRQFKGKLSSIENILEGLEQIFTL